MVIVMFGPETILFLGSLSNFQCSERIRHVPPRELTISAGGPTDPASLLSTVPKQLVCLVSLSSLKLILFQNGQGQGEGGREGGRVESGGRQLGISQAGFVLPSPSEPLT